MEIFDKYWITTPPFDFESKEYKLLAGIKQIKGLISSNSLYSAISIVEKELEKLYNIKYNKDYIESGEKKIKGIDLDTMSLAYEYNETHKDLQVIYDICDLSIDKLETLYRLIRDKWRALESECEITEIPDKKVLNTMGYIMYIVPGKDTIQIYRYTEPTSFKIDWNKFKLIKVTEIKNELREIATFIATSEVTSNSYRFFRFDVKIKSKIPPFEECMLPLMQYAIFNKIKHGI
jgi:hypothetical protein